MRNAKRASSVVTVCTALLLGQLGIASAANAVPTAIACTEAALTSAVTDANANADQTTITIPADCTIDLSKTLEVSSDLIIVGAGANTSVIRRAFDGRTSGDTFVSDGITYTTSDAPMIHVSVIGNAGTLELSGLTLDGHGSAYVGRAVYVESDGNLTVRNSEVINNNANEICDGANCVIPGESAAETDATNPGPDSYLPSASGGALYVAGTGATSVDHATFTGNTASLDGGAIYTDSNLDLWNNTFENNSSIAGAGADVATASTSTALLLNNTFVSTGESNSDVAISSGSDLVNLIGNLFANVSCQVTETTKANASNNVAAASSNCPGVATTVADLRIQPLAINADHPANSGTVRTAALLEGSSAINIYSAASIPSHAALIADDARGVARSTAVAGLIDAGAFEYIADPATVTTTDVPEFTPVAGTATLSGTVDTHGLAVTSYGFYYVKSATPVTTCNTGTKVAGSTADASMFNDSTASAATREPVVITAGLTELSSAADYYYCAFAVTAASDAEMYGTVYKFTTPANALALQLVLAAHKHLAGSTTTVSGSGLKPGSDANLYQYSTRTLVKTFTVDSFGKFSGSFVVASCGAAGDHKFRIEGLAPDSTPVADQVFYLLDPNCNVQAMGNTAFTNASVTITDVLFANKSAKLTEKYKAVLKAWLPLLRLGGSITIRGYTETKQPSKSALKACLILSKQRAIAVEKYLRTLGFTFHFWVIGNGATSPVSKKQALNRRASVSFPVIYGKQ